MYHYIYLIGNETYLAPEIFSLFREALKTPKAFIHQLSILSAA